MLEPTVVAELREIVGRRHIYSGPAELIAYSFDGTFQQRTPDLVVLPGSAEEVAAILSVANRERIPVVPRGAGTNLAGATIPVLGGVVLGLARMNRIREIDLVNTVAVVEAGVVNGLLQAAVEREGLFYPPDPASLSQCTIGGNVACNAGGPRCLKYGVTKDYVLGMTVAMANGELLRLGGKVFKNVTGYQLSQVFVGSEGTLGVIVEIVLRLLPLPRARSTMAAIFLRLEDAVQSVPDIMSAGILPVALELMDSTTIGVVEDYLHTGLPRSAEAMLILEQDGNEPTVVAREVAQMAEICRARGAVGVKAATEPAERDELWRVRRSVAGALGRRAPNRLSEDIVVPRSNLPAMIRRVREIGAKHELLIPVFGHAGDGNLHPNILFDAREPDILSRVEAAAADIFRSALELGGTLSGEHGIGTLKREFLTADLGTTAVELMRGIKRSFDPKGLLNPHKVFPQTAEPQPGFLAGLPTMGMLLD